MSNAAKKEYLVSIRSRYSKARRSEKGQILDEFCHVCGYNRKYALRLLNQPSFCKSSHKEVAMRGPKSRYDTPAILAVLKYLWRLTNLPYSKRLKAIVHLWLPYHPYYLPVAVEEKLLSISPPQKVLDCVAIQHLPSS